MRPLIVSRSDIQGGAHRAAFRLVEALRDGNVTAEMLVALKKSDVAWVSGPRSFAQSIKATLRSHADVLASRLQRGADSNLRSFSFLPSGLDRVLSGGNHDLVHLHWVGGEMLSIAEIGRIGKPVVWTAHDMWPFAGAEHYAPDDAAARWRRGYSAASRPAGQHRADLDRATFLRKQKHWRQPQHVIYPSRWLAQCARQSTLFAQWPAHVIPNPFNLNRFQPWPKALAREMMGLPQDVPLLGFGAMGGTRDPRKGWDLLLEALGLVAEAKTGAQAVIFGQSRPAMPLDLPMPAHWLGHVSDEIAMALFYSAVDVVAVPSRQDNLPQTATEAQACGCPVVAFDVCGMPDTVENGRTGLLAPAFNTEILATHIIRLLSDSDLRASQSAAARQRALTIWDPASLVAQHLAVYRLALGGS